MRPLRKETVMKIANIKNHFQAHAIEYGVAGTFATYIVGNMLLSKTLEKVITKAISSEN
ncbi:gp044 [Rhodococcus phage ReqiPepy6]|uniref:Gp044 n=1 Tax=Rhodococcus phage ReqiPepy6 TaxID=691965 RepID=D4P7F5_9CAUD|nr:gp044 [Rhodococcus phage ReqiPepy6]ADD80935.1 gp044 [Rhodococcus phage ReqiPepy6]